MDPDRCCGTFRKGHREVKAGENTVVQKPGRVNHKNMPNGSRSCSFSGWGSRDDFQESFYDAERLGIPDIIGNAQASALLQDSLCAEERVVFRSLKVAIIKKG